MKTVSNMKHELQNVGQANFNSLKKKIRRAWPQNPRGLHLNIGHTRKICTFSPCSNLSKHPNEKVEKTAIERDISQLHDKFSKIQKDVNNTKRAAEKLNNLVSKLIEENCYSLNADRYLSCGLRNWALFNCQINCQFTRQCFTLPIWGK